MKIAIATCLALISLSQLAHASGPCGNEALYGTLNERVLAPPANSVQFYLSERDGKETILQTGDIDVAGKFGTLLTRFVCVTGDEQVPGKLMVDTIVDLGQFAPRGL